ncbi:UDP-3-O-acyl-N-acetylglucosamine deacetylase [Pseudanabaena sp. FACHB-2040]|uniref:UDP-3-O-acyl-N-acetylglucosamine deacetylase n=1 Tax=Pseudanabaena sp. FACHB-2040 TaxID=2692859 RepID=UPI0016838D52|nr:UDP-3-O-acyl-N-acetylglucosamine deacetylase [Pseudanabaena sp. FACHB-2040]MBD2256319.1 UDP-3-O-acyl-N-acetylglucosamine deacetylase [Pseudanabaena sp. FACHB-2040]
MAQAITRPATLPALTAIDLEQPQQTLAQAVERQGVGLHSGQAVQVRLEPAAADSGRCFVRTDLPGRPTVAARPEAVQQTLLSTELVSGEAAVRTVEHLLAALTGMGIDNVCITIDGPEVPLLDGSASGWVEAIEAAGLAVQDAPKRAFQVSSPVWIYDGDAFVAALPSPTPRYTYGIDFEVTAIGNQWHSWSADPAAAELFAEVVAPARTFGLAHQIDYLRSQGLIKGGSLDNALVCGEEGWLNPPLRFPNEPARHKLLDLIGDMSLLGRVPLAHILAYKASHRLHVELAKTLQKALSPT